MTSVFGECKVKVVVIVAVFDELCFCVFVQQIQRNAFIESNLAESPRVACKFSYFSIFSTNAMISALLRPSKLLNE